MVGVPNWAGELVPYIAQRWERGTISGRIHENH
uniref:Uncharacterized protein n=1 Tax=Siphoviridae sp. ctCNm48 TaxID=2825377 RepID=A0A8S5TWA0_9CAUD|nr:MAG TPA: hypothetical protein [Siphoviridae sp. ctCNm48]